MASGPERNYTREMYRRFGYHATWTPGTPLQLGDVGVVRDGVYRRLRNLKDFGIPFDVRPDTTAERLKHVSTHSVEFAFKAAGKPAIPGSFLSDANAGVTIEFKRSGGVAFEALGCTTPSISDQLGLGRELIKRYRAGKWNKDYVVVTELVHADSCTVLVSESRGGKISIEASAAVSAGSFSIADASAGLGITFSRSMNTEIIAAGGLTPLMRVRRVRRPFLGSPTFRTAGVDPLDLVVPADVKEEDLVFEAEELLVGTSNFLEEEDELDEPAALSSMPRLSVTTTGGAASIRSSTRAVPLGGPQGGLQAAPDADGGAVEVRVVVPVNR